MSQLSRVVQHGLVVEVDLTREQAMIVTLCLISPGRSDVTAGSSFAYISGMTDPARRGMVLSMASARFVRDLDELEPDIVLAVADGINRADRTRKEF